MSEAPEDAARRHDDWRRLIRDQFGERAADAYWRDRERLDQDIALARAQPGVQMIDLRYDAEQDLVLVGVIAAVEVSNVRAANDEPDGDDGLGT